MDRASLTISHDPSSNLNGLVSGVAVGLVSDTRTYNGFGELDHYAAGTYVEYDLDNPGTTTCGPSGTSSCARDQLGRIVRRGET